MRTISESTIEKHIRFLRLVKDQAGKELDLQKVVQAFHLQNSTHFYARKLGFFDFTSGENANSQKILKVNYDKVEPIVARRLVEGMNRIKRENDAKRRAAKEAKMETPSVITDIAEEYKPRPKEPKPIEVKSEGHAVSITNLDAIEREIADVVSKRIHQPSKDKDNNYTHTVHIKRKYTVRFCGIPIIRVDE